jgi:hypothetical protein
MTICAQLGLCLALGQAGAWAAPAIVSVEPQSETCERYGRFEVSIRLADEYENPYDPEQIAVEARFAGPGGDETTVAGFYHVPYRNASEGGRTFTNPGIERWEAAGDPSFVVRFSPIEIGTYRWWIVARDGEGEARSDPRTLKCVASDLPGFIRVSPRNPRAFSFSNGDPFVPIGACIAWARANGPEDTYDHYFARLAENGCNAVRVWMCHWAWLEWSAGEKGALTGYQGVGRYNQMVAANFDNIVRLAERHGLHLMLCLNNGAWEFGRPDGKNDEYDSWGGNPYKVANGGPCRTPADFWTDPAARELYRRKLRYIVARWSYSPSVWAWEFWNEIGQESSETVAWHREMADYVRSIDPNGHPVSTSSWVDTAEANRETFAALDFSQLHYGSADAIAAMLETVEGKPLVIGEGTADEGGVAFHNSLWMSLMAGAAGPPLTWHDGPRSPLETHDRYGHFRAVAEFLRGENLASEPYIAERLQATAGDGAESSGARYAPVLMEPLFAPWLKKAPQGEFTVPPDGRVDTRGLGVKLYGSNPDRAPYRNPPTFLLDCATGTEFVVAVGEASGPAAVEVRVDGEVATSQSLPGEGRRYIPEDACRVSIAIPPGKHRVQVSNAGADWLAVRHYVLSAYRDRNAYPDVEAYALRGPRRVLLWAHNTSHTPEVLALGVEPSPVTGVRVRLIDLDDGEYRIEEWDTATGERGNARIQTCRNGALDVSLPAVATDVAMKVFAAAE